MLGHQGKQVFIITTQNYKIPEGEFFVKKVMSWEGVRREFGLRYL